MHCKTVGATSLWVCGVCSCALACARLCVYVCKLCVHRVTTRRAAQHFTGTPTKLPVKWAWPAVLAWCSPLALHVTWAVVYLDGIWAKPPKKKKTIDLLLSIWHHLTRFIGNKVGTSSTSLPYSSNYIMTQQCVCVCTCFFRLALSNYMCVCECILCDLVLFEMCSGDVSSDSRVNWVASRLARFSSLIEELRCTAMQRIETTQGGIAGWDALLVSQHCSPRPDWQSGGHGPRVTLGTARPTLPCGVSKCFVCWRINGGSFSPQAATPPLWQKDLKKRMWKVHIALGSYRPCCKARAMLPVLAVAKSNQKDFQS